MVYCKIIFTDIVVCFLVILKLVQISNSLTKMVIGRGPNLMNVSYIF